MEAKPPANVASQSEASEVERWVQASQCMLTASGKPLHCLDIKRVITESNLVPTALKTTLDASLLKEVRKETGVTEWKCLPLAMADRNPEAERLAQLEMHTTVRAQPQGVKSQPPTKFKSKNQYHTAGVNGSGDKYRMKYLRLKKFLKHMVFLNAALCDEVSKVDGSVAQVREQRRYLIRRLQRFQVMPEVLPPPPPAPPPPPKPTPPSLPSVPAGGIAVKSPSTMSPPGVLDVKPDPDKLVKMKKKPTPTPKSKKAQKDMLGILSGEIGKPKPKKTKASSAKRMVVPILLDNTGRPIFPIELGPLTIHSLGEITTDRSRYHSAEHIYPVGFCSTRVYGSLRNPAVRTLYTCKILDYGMGPKFEISPEDAPDQVISCDSADECHTRLLAYVNNARGVEVVTPEPRGAEFFGFSHPTVQNLIQCCPGARKCSGYKWVRFEVCRTDPTDVLNFFHEDPVINFDALQQSQKYLQGIEQQKQMQQNAIMEPSSSLRSLLTSGPLIQTPHS